MDLSDALKATSISTESNDTNPAEDSLIVPALSKRDQFFATYKYQSFSLPDSLMFYIAKNPTTPELYQKLVESCKEFFVKNPVIVASDLCYENGQWEINRKPYDLNKFSCKFWITGEFTGDGANAIKHKPLNQNIVASVIPKLYRCGAKAIKIWNQTISYDDLSFLISSAEAIDLCDITVKDENGTNVAVENIVEVAVKAKRIGLRRAANFTSKTMKELISIPCFSTIDFVVLTHLSDVFDIEAFYAYMKKNQRTKFILDFNDSISDAFKNRLEQIIDEILATKVFDHKVPFFGFNGMNEEKSEKYYDVFRSH